MTLDNRQKASFLQACIDQKSTAQDVVESLVLRHGEADDGEIMFFHLDVTHLGRDVHAVSKTFTSDNENYNASQQLELIKDPNVFGSDLHFISTKYGPRVWGRTSKRPLVSPGHNANYSKELFWEEEKDRDKIEFYIRCWAVAIASSLIRKPRLKSKGKQKNSGTKSKLQRQKGKNAQSTVQSTTLENESALSGRHAESSRDSFRAPEAHMDPTLVYSEAPERERSQTAAPYPNSTRSAIELTRDDSDEDDIYADTPKTPSPLKRKNSITINDSARSRLSKLRKGVYSTHKRDEGLEVAGRQSAQYFGQRKRENMQDVDPTYEPSLESSTVISGEGSGNAAMEDIFDTVLQTYSEGRSPPYDSKDDCSTGYSSVVALQNSVALNRDSEVPTLQAEENSSEIMSHEIEPTTEFSKEAADTDSSEEQKLRRELFMLLLSRLNNINEFSPGNPTSSISENRLSRLLWQFWLNGKLSLQLNYQDYFHRLSQGFESWMDMRDRLQVFQNSTKYYGRPGQEWLAHLRSILDCKERAQACIALAKMKDQGIEGSKNIDEEFFGDMAWLFDWLTKFPGCNGVEEFRSVGDYSRNLLDWFL